jgi:hypothetical protein
MTSGPSEMLIAIEAFESSLKRPSHRPPKTSPQTSAGWTTPRLKRSCIAGSASGLYTSIPHWHN